MLFSRKIALTSYSFRRPPLSPRVLPFAAAALLGFQMGTPEVRQVDADAAEIEPIAERIARAEAPITWDAAHRTVEPVSGRSIGTGHASWYGPGFAGRPTASGEIFDPRELTAAHKTLPMGSNVRVTNVANGESVVVRINDRGPFVPGRLIDLSEEAAEQVGIKARGVGTVELELLP